MRVSMTSKHSSRMRTARLLTVSREGGLLDTDSPLGDRPPGHVTSDTCREEEPPVNRMTHACEKLPSATSFAFGKNRCFAQTLINKVKVPTHV